MKISFLTLLSLIFFTAIASAGESTPPRVVVSIAPIHSLTAGIMAGTGQPKLLLRSGASPHSSSLRPSDLSAIEQADLIIWVGPQMEQFLDRAIHTARPESTILTLMQTDGLTLHSVRDGGIWHAAAHNEHEDHTFDPHIWLNPQNAIQITTAISAQLSKVDPHRAALYRLNSKRVIERLQALDRQLQQRLSSIQNIPYIVFHDAYQTFEAHYSLSPAGAVTIDPERRPGARRLIQIRDYLQTSQAVCLFSEPQFEPRYIAPLTEGTAIRTGVLDPLGSTLTPGTELYFELMQRLADALVSCLAPVP
jgi:zinc transport system substrate-binding protein